MAYLAHGFRSAALAIAVGAVALLSGPAHAAPLTSAKSAISQLEDSALTLVRDGCGRGYRWSNRRGGCVPDEYYGGPAPGPGYVDPGAAIVNGIIGGVLGAPPAPVCPPGTRWSNRAGGCVYY